MNRNQLEDEVSQGKYDEIYAEWVNERANGETLICNGDDLIRVMESNRYFDEFVDYLEGTQ